MGLIEAAGREWIERHADEALAEDLGRQGDITSLATVPSGLHGRAELIARQAGVLAGIDWAVECGRRADPPAEWRFFLRDGDRVDAGGVIAEVTGPLRGILISERPALNGLAHLSGIATVASKAAELVRGTKAKVYDTRKTHPGWRLAEKYAVRTGGAENHRLGLHDAFLIKENHIRAAGGVAGALRAAKSWRRSEKGAEGAAIEIEVTNLDELREALREGPDQVLLDNFSLEELREAVAFTAGRCALEASGGITLENLADVAATGVDRISLGALTHSVRPLDLSLLVRETSDG